MIGGTRTFLVLAVLGLALTGCKSPAQADFSPAAPAATAHPTPPSGSETLADVGTLLGTGQYAQALEVLKMLTGRGDRKAEATLAELYLMGPPATRNVEAGLTLARAGAAANEPGAELMLGLAYLQGLGVAKDVAMGISLYEKAAAQNDAAAESELGALYSSDRYVPKDAAKSVKWIADAAEQGWGLALYNVAAGFSDGSILPRDPRQAFFWFTVSLPRLGENPQAASKAVHGRDKAATEMTLDETRSLQIMAQIWVPVKGSLDGVRAQAGKATVGPIPRGSGSGIMLNAAGQVLTANHVVKACKRVTVSAPGGTPVDAAIGAHDETADLAILKAVSPVGRPAQFRADDAIRQGERVLAAGYPISNLLGSELNTTEGTISSIAGWRANRNGVLFSAAVSPGNSGGPLIAADGAVIGVVEGQLDNLVLSAAAGIVAENVNFASNVQSVRQFLDKNAVAYEHAAPGREMSAIDLSDRARTYTLLVTCEE